MEMKMTVILEKHLSDLIGKNVISEGNIVGKITEYDSESGLATIATNEIGYNPIVGNNIGLSSRKLK